MKRSGRKRHNIFSKKPGDRRLLGILIGQIIYTSEDLERRDLILDDRPYAGYTYLGVSVHRTDPEIMDTIELDVGIVGPDSYAEDDLLHLSLSVL